jgi:hypothetical protein
MSISDPYGPVCPFCRTAVPAAATVCTGCGARKGARVDLVASPLGRFFVWCSTVGVVLVAWLGGTWILLTSPPEMLLGPLSQYFSRPPFMASMSTWLVAIGWFIGGLLVFKLVVAVWRGLFGRLSDPHWVR